jgi:hypothetical protein
MLLKHKGFLFKHLCKKCWPEHQFALCNTMAPALIKLVGAAQDFTFAADQASERWKHCGVWAA